ncbi:MAG: hypothetical protein C4519_28525 [Desulfobacteraceae bacterium]|nr:MAG: hypothetical protein C4519_28525 [Desulfobacteraceae bacterium]
MTRRRLIAGVIVAACFLGLFKPAVIRTDRETRLAFLFRFQSGQIRFVNSVTDRPVAIHFRIGSRFQAFSYHTDETTEAYYTHGVYGLNQTAGEESTARLRFCSVKGLVLTIGFYTMRVQDGCLEVALLWKI